MFFAQIQHNSMFLMVLLAFLRPFWYATNIQGEMDERFKSQHWKSRNSEYLPSFLLVFFVFLVSVHGLVYGLLVKKSTVKRATLKLNHDQVGGQVGRSG